MGPETPITELLVACTADADGSAWEEFIRRFHPVIAGTVAKTAHNWGQTNSALLQELTQEVYLRLCASDYRLLRSFVPEREESIFAFLKAVAFSGTHDHFRSSHAAKRGAGRTEVELSDRVAVGDPIPEVERRMLMEEIESCLTAVASPEHRDRDRLIFLLHYRDGLTSKAIAAMPTIGLSQKGVEATLQRLVNRVRRHFSAQAGAD